MIHITLSFVVHAISGAAAFQGGEGVRGGGLFGVLGNAAPSALREVLLAELRSANALNFL
ncbi:hypothetical protein DBP20_10015 [Streptomyces sp. CS131]|nr:hypothetical protein DBP20_10015 [Streptomyces sp. CS131]